MSRLEECFGNAVVRRRRAARMSGLAVAGWAVLLIACATARAGGVEVRYGAERALPLLISPLTGRPTGPSAIGVDGAGDVFELIDGYVVVLPAGAGSASAARVLPGLPPVDEFAVNSAGDVLGLNPSTVGLREVRAGGGAATAEIHQSAYLLAIDGSGDAYLAQALPSSHYSAGSLIKVPFSMGGFTQDLATVPQFPAGPSLDLSYLGGLAVSAAGDVYESDLDPPAGDFQVEMLRGGTLPAVPVPFSELIGPVAVDPWGGVYGVTLPQRAGPPQRPRGTAPDRVVMLPSGACQADEVRLPFTDLHSPRAVTVDARGDVYVEQAGNRPVMWLPRIGVRTPPRCPMKLLDFMLRGLTRDGRAAHERPTLRFELSGVSAHAIKRITITAPNGLLFNRNPRALARELVLVREDGRAAVHTALATSTTLRITLGRAVERISLVLRRGALRLPPHPGFGLYDAHGFPTFLTVSGARGRTIHLMG